LLVLAEVFEVVLQVVRGLAAIHDAGVIHCDLKISNIVRDRTGAVRLLDFASPAGRPRSSPSPTSSAWWGPLST
jgi:serine/threonine-protein kinase